MKEKLIKGLKYLKTNAITTTIVLVVLGGGTVLAANFAGSSPSSTTVNNNSTEVTTQSESTTAEATTQAVEETTQEVTTEAVTEAPVQKAVAQEVVTEAPTEAPTQTPTFEFYQVDGGYALVKIYDNGNLPSVLEVPSTYNGLPVVKISSGVLSGISITTFIIPSSVTAVDTNLCGLGSLCPTLQKIVCQGTTPFSLGSLALTTEQGQGTCSIYIPDGSIEAYKTKWNTSALRGCYDKLMKPLSTY